MDFTTIVHTVSKSKRYGILICIVKSLFYIYKRNGVVIKGYSFFWILIWVLSITDGFVSTHIRILCHNIYLLYIYLSDLLYGTVIPFHSNTHTKSKWSVSVDIDVCLVWTRMRVRNRVQITVSCQGNHWYYCLRCGGTYADLLWVFGDSTLSVPECAGGVDATPGGACICHSRWPPRVKPGGFVLGCGAPIGFDWNFVWPTAGLPSRGFGGCRLLEPRVTCGDVVLWTLPNFTRRSRIWGLLHLEVSVLQVLFGPQGAGFWFFLVCG